MGFDLTDFNEDVQKQIKAKMTGGHSNGENLVKKQPGKKFQAKAVHMNHPDRMNKTERKYSNLLQKKKINEEILDWKHEPFNLRLGDNTFYKPDFAVLANDMTIEIHEVKGVWRDDALVKIKAAAYALPWFKFVAAFYESRRWEYRYF